MAKGIFKQVIITLLIIVAVALILAVIFYNYIPTNKVIPAKVSEYKTPESIESEIKDSATEQEFTSENQLLEITDSDLNMYKSSMSYNPGKSDPFAQYTEESSSSNTVEGSTTASSTSASQSQTTSVDKNTTDNYYQAAGVNAGGK